MKKFRKLIVSLLLLCFVLAAVGCNGGDNGNNNGGDANTGDFELQIFTGGYGDEMWRYVLEIFEEDHPDLNVTAYMSNNVNDEMAGRWKKGNTPDFVFLDGTLDTSTWLKLDLMYDFTDWLNTAKVNGEDTLIKDKVDLGNATKYTQKNGNTITYGMPLILGSYGMWYSNALFTKNGWSVPRNYEELKTFTANNATAKIKAITYLGGDASGYIVQGFILPALAEYGEEFYRRVENASDAEVFTSAEFKAVMNRFEEFVKSDNGITKEIDEKWETVQTNWLNNSSAFIPNGLWLRKELSAQLGESGAKRLQDFDMRYTPSPLVTEKQVVITTAVSCGVAKNAKNRAAALEFLTYLYRDDVVKKFVEYSESPSAANVDVSDVKATDTLKYAQQVINDPAYIKYGHVGSWGNEVNEAFNLGVKAIVGGTKKADGTPKTAEDVCMDLFNAAKRQLAA